MGLQRYEKITPTRYSNLPKPTKCRRWSKRWTTFGILPLILLMVVLSVDHHTHLADSERLAADEFAEDGGRGDGGDFLGREGDDVVEELQKPDRVRVGR